MKRNERRKGRLGARMSEGCVLMNEITKIKQGVFELILPLILELGGQDVRRGHPSIQHLHLAVLDFQHLRARRG